MTSASPDISTDWEAATAAVLRKTRRLADGDPDAAVWDKLTRTTLDDIAVAPIGTPEQNESLITSGRPTRRGPWDVRVTVDLGAPSANADALAELNTGANSLVLHGSGDVRAALEGVLLDLAPVVIDGPAETRQAFVEAVQGSELHPATNLGADALADDVAAVAAQAVKLGVLAAVVDATRIHERGASDAQELGWSLAAAVACLRTLDAAGMTPADAAGLLEFRYAATDEQFPTIAKLRAARRCWTRVLELCGVEGIEQRQHAVTSRAMMSKYDPYVNMLRGTVAAFAAGVGGAEAVTVLPFDAPFGSPNALGRRIARNTSALLIEESHVAAVSDPAGGSYAVEKLTDDLAQAAWAEFVRIEGAGGVTAGAAEFEERVAKVAERREADIATRKRPLTGVSEFPNLHEELPVRDGEPDPRWLSARRYGAAFEALRDEPAQTKVFMATMGSIAQHTARATFATNLFAAGGVDVVAAGPTVDVDAVVAAYEGQPVVCLAGTDAAYAEWAAPLIEALRAKGAQRVILAGKPGELNVDDSCAMGVDALAFLNRTREALS